MDNHYYNDEGIEKQANNKMFIIIICLVIFIKSVSFSYKNIYFPK